MPPVARPASTWKITASIAILVAQVRSPHGVVALDVGGRAREHDAPGLDQVGAVGEIERHGGVLLDEQHADALALVDGAQDAEQLAHQQRREPEGGLVEQHQPGREHQRARYGKHLLLAARQRARLLRAALPQLREIAEDALEIGGDGRPIPAGVGAKAQVLLGGEVEKGAAAVRDVRDSKARNVLVLPAPFAPSKAVIDFSPIAKLIPWITRVAP